MVIDLLCMSIESHIVSVNVFCELFFGRDEAVQAAAVPLQDEAGSQASGFAVSVVEGLDGGKLIMYQAGNHGNRQVAAPGVLSPDLQSRNKLGQVLGPGRKVNRVSFQRTFYGDLPLS